MVANCVRCNWALGPNDKFCRRCGTPVAPAPFVAPPAVQRVCPSCGAPAKGRFCGKCGTRIPDVIQAPASVQAAPVPAERHCSRCGAVVRGRFCGKCGTPVPDMTDPAPNMLAVPSPMSGRSTPVQTAPMSPSPVGKPITPAPSVNKAPIAEPQLEPSNTATEPAIPAPGPQAESHKKLVGDELNIDALAAAIEELNGGPLFDVSNTVETDADVNDRRAKIDDGEIADNKIVVGSASGSKADDPEQVSTDSEPKTKESQSESETAVMTKNDAAETEAVADEPVLILEAKTEDTATKTESEIDVAAESASGRESTPEESATEPELTSDDESEPGTAVVAEPEVPTREAKLSESIEPETDTQVASGLSASENPSAPAPAPAPAPAVSEVHQTLPESTLAVVAPAASSPMEQAAANQSAPNQPMPQQVPAPAPAPVPMSQNPNPGQPMVLTGQVQTEGIAPDPLTPEDFKELGEDEQSQSFKIVNIVLAVLAGLSVVAAGVLIWLSIAHPTPGAEASLGTDAATIESVQSEVSEVSDQALVRIIL